MQQVSLSNKQTPGARLWRNRNFNIFWFGQSLSVLGDAFAFIALPLLVLQATGSVVEMGLVTGVFGVGQVVMGIFAGMIVDKVDRRRLMIFCDALRTLLYLAIPLCWLWFGPQIWLIFVVVALGSCLGMTFQITYVTAIANLVDGDQITEANGRMEATYSIAFILGPVLAGIISSSFGPTFAMSIDACSFAASAISLCFIRLRPVTRVSSLELLKSETPEQADLPRQTQEVQRQGFIQEFLAGVRFLWHEPTLRSITIVLSFFTLIITGAIDILIFHLKHDLGQGDSSVGLVFGLASVGGLFAALALPYLRKRLGFGVCWLGGIMLSCLSLALIGLSTSLLLIAFLAVCFTFSSTLSGVSSLSLRQQITPDHLLGRVTSAFWTIHTAPGPLGAALFTAVSAHIGARDTLLLMGLLGLLITVTGLFTPARQRYPERTTRSTQSQAEPIQQEEVTELPNPS
jgi:MFS family permease